MKGNYYAQNLNAQKLFQVYQTGYPRVKQYLEAEITFVKNHLKGTERILELGAGYGRIIKELAPYCESIVGIDISNDNVEFGKAYLNGVPNARLIVMNAHQLSFQERFDIILCLQNGLSSMKIEPVEYMNRMMGLIAKGGKAFISGYSPEFWEHRVAWFKEQAEKGLLGEIDMDKTKDGVIVCKDGFRSATFSHEEMDAVGRKSGYEYEVTQVDGSSIFLVISKSL